MTRKVAALLLVALLFTGSVAHAGDIPESIMTGGHEAMFIGEIVSIGSSTMRIKPLTVMMGKVTVDELEVKRIESYSLYPHNPRKGDFIVALLIDASTMDETWVFECSSSDYKTLQIVCDEVDMVLCYQKYINEGAYFDAQVPPLSEPAGIASVAAGGAGSLRGYAIGWEWAALIFVLLVLAFVIAIVLFRRRKHRVMR